MFLSASLALLFVSGTAEAQFGRRLGKAVENAAKKTVERKAEQKTEEAVGSAIDKATDPGTYKNKDGGESRDNKDGKKPSSQKQSSNDGDSVETPDPDVSAEQPPTGAKAAERTYAKSDFVPGDEIIFDDPMDNEQMGEFPSQWDLLSGVSEVAMANGKKGFELSHNNDKLTPLMKNAKNYLGDAFTVEFDFLSVKPQESTGLWMTFDLLKSDQAKDAGYPLMHFRKASNLSGDGRFVYEWAASNGDRQRGNGEIKMDFDTWHHFAVSFNKRAWKIYVNGVRIVNVPNVATPPGWLTVYAGNAGKGNMLFTNFRIAKGAVPLYDRTMSDGKIISYGIAFDVGKSTIKPESMGEINRIATLMKENPDLKFSVEGHTDATGTAAANQTLSDARSKAVVDKLVEMGVAKDRLASAGKGQTSPVADNATDGGRAKNRRVEFVKI